MTLRNILTDKIEDALTVLSDKLSFNNLTADSHHVLEITGWQEAECIAALSVYFVALRASIIDQAGVICSELIDNRPDYVNDIIKFVDEIAITPDGTDEEEAQWKSDSRNPWIAEGIWHCYMRIAMDRHELHSAGMVIAINLPHISAKDHGQDVTALYVKEDGVLGMSLVETKAYRNNPNNAISGAVATFKDIEVGRHDTRLRQVVTSFRSIIGESNRQRLSSSLWKNERILIPNPHYDSEVTVQWNRRRTIFAPLKAPVVIMPNAIDSFDEFFDKIAQGMHVKAEELMADV